MGLCEECDIETKVIYCCGSHPETKKSKMLKLEDGSFVRSCPNLDSEGYCYIYNNRPEDCINYECEKIIEEEDLFTRFSKNWGLGN